jgi:hypothetical protein
MTDSSSSSFGADWLVGAVKKNPEGLLLLAAGCALLLRRGASGERPQRGGTYRGERHDGERQWDSSGRAVDRDQGVSGRMSRAADDALEYASEMGKTVSETAGQYASKVSDAAGRYASAVSDYADDARTAVVEQSGRLAEQAQSTVERIVREQPLAVAFAGLAAGAAVAAAFPATSIERRTLGPAGERLSEAAESAREKLGEAASAAGERLKDVAEERGLNGEGLKKAARDVAGAFQESFAGEKEAASSFGQNRAGSAAGGSTSHSGSSGSGGGTTRASGGGTSSASPGSTSGAGGSSVGTPRPSGGGSSSAPGGTTSRSDKGTPSNFGSGSHSK